MLGNFNEEAQFIILKSKEEMIELNHPYIGTEHLVLSILKNNLSLASRLKEYGLTYESFKLEILNIVGKGSKKTEFFLYTPLLKKVIENSMLDAKDNNNGEVTVEHLFGSILEEGEGIAIRIFIGMDIDIDELYDEFSSNLVKKNRFSKKKLLVDELGVDLIQKVKENKVDPVIGRDNEIKRLIEILCRRCKNNPILIGEAGVGKTAIVEYLASMIYHDEVPSLLRDKRIISLDMASVVSGTKYRGEFEERMQKIIKEVEEDGNIILFVDEIHTMVGAGGAEGAIDASNILKPALARGEIRCIGATTTLEYKKYIEADKALSRRFQSISVKEPDVEETFRILQKVKSIYEKYHGVEISDSALRLIVDLSDKYIHNRYNPDKSIDILDEVCSMVRIKDNPKRNDIEKLKDELEGVTNDKNNFILDKELDKAYHCRKKEALIHSKINELELHYKRKVHAITKEDVAQVIHKATNIPVYEIFKDDMSVIKKLKQDLGNEIVGQGDAISCLVNYTKKMRLGYTSHRVNSFLFVGPSGVGKTCLAKMYAKYCRGEDNFIKLDMSEYSDSISINKIIGSSPGYVGYSDNNCVLDKIREKPFAVILFDEIDKAHYSVINLLYQMLDDGKITDSKNNVVNLSNNIIIMTSNVGFEKLSVGFTNKHEGNVLSDLKEKFSVSLMNRMDNVLVFKSLNKKDIKVIVKKKLEKLKDKYDGFSYTDNLVEDIIKKSEYQEFGARKIGKIIDSRLEGVVIDRILSGESLEVDSLREEMIV